MAKRTIPPKGTTTKNIKKIVKQGPKTQANQTLRKGPSQSHVARVIASKQSTPSQNQRGKIKGINDRELTR